MNENQEMNEMEAMWSDRQDMVWLNRAHLIDDDSVPEDPRDWNVDG
jgi:hypothetical protein